MELPTLEVLDEPEIAEFTDTVVFDDKAIPAIIQTITTTARDMCSDIEEFQPSPTSFAGSSEDVIANVTKILKNAAESYQILEQPVQHIMSEAKKVKEAYDSIISATGGGN